MILGLLALAISWPLAALLLVIAVVWVIVGAVTGRKGVIDWVINDD